jgi:hypothetical protein
MPLTPKDFKEGEPGESGYFSVNNTVANEPPTIEITSGPENGSTVDTKKVTFAWQGTDPEGALAGYYYSFDHDPPNVLTNETSVESDWLTNGEHTFRVLSMDNAGAFSDVASRTFTVDAVNQPPTVTISSPTEGAVIDCSSMTVEWRGSDDDGYVAGYYYSMDNPGPDNWTIETNYVAGGLSNGSHIFYIKAQDNEGTNSSVVSMNFSVSIGGGPKDRWHKMYGGSAYEFMGLVQESSDNGYIVGGFSTSTDITGCVNHGKGDYYVIKLGHPV